MKHQLNIFIIVLLAFSWLPAKADSWMDPEWKEMIDSSDVIALVEYTSKGNFRAKARPLTIFKGHLSANEFWISGFSNRYGPIDKKKPGERYIVFLNFSEPTDKRLEYWQKQVQKEPELSDFYDALKSGNVYTVWSPTSGDLRVKGKTVQYDLLQTTYYKKQNYYPLAPFEAFLKATIQMNNATFHLETLKKLKRNINRKISSQYIMMLYLSSFNAYDPVFRKIANQQNPKPCFALAKLLGQQKDLESRDILVQLLNNKYSFVQGEAVRQLSHGDPDFIGPILLSHLNSAGEKGIYPRNIMVPVMNSLDGGKIEIIRALGKIQYQPAAKSLLSLLETENLYIFETVIDALIQLDNKDFIPYINNHLKKRTKTLIFKICRIITENNLIECKPALMEFISNHNRNEPQTYEYAISTYMGLAYFDDIETRNFLLNDFYNMISNDTLKDYNSRNWIEQHIQTFTYLKEEEAKPIVYQSLFKWFGYNYDFAVHPELFELKKQIEDSINQRSLEILENADVSEIRTIVFIQNTSDYGVNFIPTFEQISLIKLNPMKTKVKSIDEIWRTLDKVKKDLSEVLNIPVGNVSAMSGSFVSGNVRRFDDDRYWFIMGRFYSYVTELPNENDLLFLKALARSGVVKVDFHKRKLDEVITEIEEIINNNKP